MVKYTSAIINPEVTLVSRYNTFYCMHWDIMYGSLLVVK